VPVVEAAFELDPNSARFYLRKRGKSQFSRTAPAVVVPGEDFAPMRERFIGELDLLVAMGGDSSEEPSGTGVEIDMALARFAPVIILSQAGGNAAKRKPGFMRDLSQSYGDPKLAGAIRKLNEDLDSVTAEALPGYFSEAMVDRIEDLLLTSMSTSERRSTDDENVADLRKW